jgi:hypothetical protein|eukprot:COSAG06_NODE_2882_length_6137_cov_32.350613_7_plen_109_part_00
MLNEMVKWMAAGHRVERHFDPEEGGDRCWASNNSYYDSSHTNALNHWADCCLDPGESAQLRSLVEASSTHAHAHIHCCCVTPWAACGPAAKPLPAACAWSCRRMLHAA